MSRVERWIYRDLLELYCIIERPLPLDIATLCQLYALHFADHHPLADDGPVVQSILATRFERTAQGFFHARCAQHIAQSLARMQVARTNGKRGGRPKKVVATTHPPPQGFASASAEIVEEHRLRPEPTEAVPHGEQFIIDPSPATSATKAGSGSPTAANAIPAMPSLPKWLPQQAWQEYCAMRSALKKPLTETATRLAISKLATLREQGHAPQAVLEQSVFYQWLGLFEVKASSTPAQQALDLQAAQRASTEEGRLRLFGPLKEIFVDAEQ